MQNKPKRACAYLGCPEVTDKRYCPKNAAIAAKEYNATRDPNFNQRYGRQWKKIRAAYISKHPLCEECEKAGRLVPAKEVHHKIPLASGGTNAKENPQELCKSCHSRHTLNDTRTKIY